MKTNSSNCRGWIFYDGDCSLCVETALRFKTFLNRRGFEIVPLQSDFARARLNLSPDKLLDEMKLLTDAGQIFGGADALLQIARRIWWARPIFALSKIPGIAPLFRANYRRLAANRTGFGGKCLIPEDHYHNKLNQLNKTKL